MTNGVIIKPKIKDQQVTELCKCTSMKKTIIGNNRATIKYKQPNSLYFIVHSLCLKIILSFIVYSSSFIVDSYGQKSEHRLEALANAKPGKIQLRWSPASYISWEIGNKYGYMVERFTIVRNGELVDDPTPVLLTPQPLKVYTLQQMQAAAAKDDKVEVIAEILYGEEGKKKTTPEDGIGAYFETKNQNDWRMAMALLTCDLSIEAAKSAALYLEDNTVKKGEKYAYRVYVARQPKNLVVDTAYITSSLDDPIKLFPPQELAIVCADSTATLGWLTSYSKSMYSAWQIERSKDGKKFVPVSELPVIPTNPDARGFSYYQDSLPDNDRIYHYRMRGLTPFGEHGPYSKIVQGVGVPSISDRPVLDTMIVIENKRIQLRWLLPGTLSKQLNKIVIVRSQKSAGPFLPIAELKPNATTFTDNKPFNSNYYRIKGITKSGKAVYSFPYFGQLIDITPPVSPVGLAGTIDSSGIVTLHWKPNTEKDLQGYRVFRGNSAKEEFMEVTREILRSTTYTDTVSLHTLSSKVFYKIIAVDLNYNTSDYTPYIVIKRPDTIAPVAPVFIKAYRSDSLKAIVLQWINSSSEDVVKHSLQRVSLKDSSRKQIAVWDTTTKRNTYVDTALQQGNTYYYELTAFDDSNNKTNELTGDIFFETGKRAAITEWNAKADNEKKQVLLTWNCTQPGVMKYFIYRKKNDLPYILFTTIEGNAKQYTDKEIVVGSKYCYRIIAVLQNDVKTEASKEVEVKF